VPGFSQRFRSPEDAHTTDHPPPPLPLNRSRARAARFALHVFFVFFHMPQLSTRKEGQGRFHPVSHPLHFVTGQEHACVEPLQRFPGI
jgi:hypothetical protein